MISTLDLGAKAKPHYITPLAPGDNRFAIADYFLDREHFHNKIAMQSCIIIIM